MKNSKIGSTLLHVFLALLIIAILFLLFTKSAHNNHDSADSPKGFIQSQGLDTSSYKGALDSTKKKLQEIEEQRQTY